MKPDSRFLGRSMRFWAHAKFLSEQLGYTQRQPKGTPKRKSAADGALPEVSQARSYTVPEARDLLLRSTLSADDHLVVDVVEYLNWRACLLNRIVYPLLMNREQAALAYVQLKAKTGSARDPSMNRQTGDKKHPAYLASMVALVAESVLGSAGFIDDAQRLSVVTRNNILEGIFSRRFDGATPDTKDPKAVWEIKEYYNDKSFGSRVAGGVYETLLDGYEVEGARKELNTEIKHFLFIDARDAWWTRGKSYLCRMIDMLHTGHVDQIFFGREVLTEWETALRNFAGTPPVPEVVLA